VKLPHPTPRAKLSTAVQIGSVLLHSRELSGRFFETKINLKNGQIDVDQNGLNI
jgi:hypothetical protein